MPFEESGSGSNLYYSFDAAGVHVIMLGSYTDYDEESDQYAWLKVSRTVMLTHLWKRRDRGNRTGHGVAKPPQQLCQALGIGHPLR
jgi:hypothetical protein